MTVAIAILLVGVYLLVTYAFGNVYWALLGGGLGFFATGWLYYLASDQSAEALRRRLREEPESIAWVYGEVTERMPFGLTFMRSATLHLVDPQGRTSDYALKPSELKLVSKTLNRVLPHAEFGWSQERADRYAPQN